MSCNKSQPGIAPKDYPVRRVAQLDAGKHLYGCNDFVSREAYQFGFFRDRWQNRYTKCYYPQFWFADTRRGMAARGCYLARSDEKDIRRSQQRWAFCICMSSCIEVEDVQCLLFAAGNSECHRFCCDRVHVTIYYGTCAGSAYLR
jgi:hypothetical protein